MYLQFFHELRDNGACPLAAKAHHNPLGLLQHERDVTRHAGQTGQIVECRTDVCVPHAQSTPHVLHLFGVVIAILGEREEG